MLLAEHFLRRFSTKYGKPVRRIDGAARDRLLTYPWPGNVRELSHVIERAVLWSRDSTLTPEHLSLTAPGEPSSATSIPVRGEAAGGAENAPRGETAAGPEWAGADLTEVERSMIERAMQEAGGNQTRAAQRLGISRDTLRYRLKKFGLQGG
jgi:DNA-binding NtrC family response regulator